VTLCRVYWGSHGCDLERGHDGHHFCNCCECTNHPDPDSGCVGAYPYYGPETNFYGDDASTSVVEADLTDEREP
jgi:hypothetical protein